MAARLETCLVSKQRLKKLKRSAHNNLPLVQSTVTTKLLPVVRYVLGIIRANTSIAFAVALRVAMGVISPNNTWQHHCAWSAVASFGASRGPCLRSFRAVSCFTVAVIIAY